jgi:mediator of RNA polymerase II transcription subunit 27
MTDISASLEELRQLSNQVFLTGGSGLSVDRDTSKDHSWLSDLQTQLGSVNSSVQDIETAAAQFNAQTNVLMVGNVDTDPQLESFNLYSELAKNHRWIDKVHEYAVGASAFLQQNGLKRSYCSVAKSRRKPLSTCHIAQPDHLTKMIAGINNMFSDMKVTVSRPGGSMLNAVVEVHLDRILKSVIIFKGLMIEWVVVKGWKEDLLKADGQVDIWGESRYQVFQRITENANAAMFNFQSAVYPDLAVRSFMTYLHSFCSLFSDKCKQCGCHLQNNLPPTWREFRTLEPFHEDCRV